MNGNIATASEHGLEVLDPVADGTLMAARPELYWRARYLRAGGSPEHLPLLFWLVCELRPRRAVTVNMGTGVLHFGLCQAADKIDIGTICHGIGDWPAANWTADVPQAIADYNAENYGDVSTLMADATGSATDRFRRDGLDLLIAESPLRDGTVAAIADLWLPCLSDRAVVLLSGINDLYGAALDRMQALRQQNVHICLDLGSGLLVLLAGARVPERLRRMAEMDPQGPGRRSFDRIISRVAALHVDECRARGNAGLEARLGDATARLAESEARLKALEGSIDTDRGASERALAAAETRNLSEIRALTRTLEDQEDRRIALADALAAAEARLADRDRLEEKLDLALRKLKAAEAKLAKRDGIADDLTELRTKLREATSRLADRDATIRTHRGLEKRLQVAEASLARRETRIKELVAERQALEASTSWRITAPLRRARLAVKKLR